MVKQRIHHLFLFIFFINCQWLSAQNCDFSYSYMDNLRQKSTQLLMEDSPSNNNLRNMKDELEEVLAKCTTEDFQGKEMIEYHYLENILNLCRKLADIEGEVKYLQVLETHPNRTDKYNNTNFEIERINAEYGPLHIRFKDKNVIKEMATLKTNAEDEVTISILPPVNAWSDIKPSERKKRLNRLNFIKNQSRGGRLKVYFDSYNDEEKFFYFVLPYVPYLEKSKSSDGWYAITFDDKKRYRFNFPQPNSNEPVHPLIIQPETGWILEVSTPEKWVKLSFADPKLKLKFYDRNNGNRLTESDYIEIRKDKNVEFYLPSDKNIDIEYPHRGEALWNYLNKILYGSLSFILGYYIYTGVS